MNDQNPARDDPNVNLAKSIPSTSQIPTPQGLIGTGNSLEEEELIKLSQVLSMGVIINQKLIRTFQAKAAELGSKKKLTAKEARWMADYCTHHTKLQESAVDSSGDLESNENYLEAEAMQDKNQSNERGFRPRANYPAIRINELVKKPEIFDGNKPPARRWIDDYEKAAQVNGWPDAVKVKYFSTFLDRAANDWFVTVAKRKLGDSPVWSDLRAAFIRHYLGDADKQMLRRQLEQTKQGERERATNFIPRVLRMIELVDPDKSERDLVDIILSKLRIIFQDKLVLANLYTIEQLNDACLRIESNLESRNPKYYEKQANKNKEKEEIDDNLVKDAKDAPRNSSKEKPTYKCYRCDRPGHVSKYCRATSKENGEPCNSKPQNREVINALPNLEDENQESKEEAKLDKANVVARIRAAGSTSISTICADNGCIIQPLEISGIKANSIVDTGAAVTLVREDLITNLKLPLSQSHLVLRNAEGGNLGCIGMIRVEINLSIGPKTKTLSHDAYVIRDLCHEVIMGIDILKAFKIVIDPASRQPLRFGYSDRDKPERKESSSVENLREKLKQNAINLVIRDANSSASTKPLLLENNCESTNCNYNRVITKRIKKETSEESCNMKEKSRETNQNDQKQKNLNGMKLNAFINPITFFAVDRCFKMPSTLVKRWYIHKQKVIHHFTQITCTRRGNKPSAAFCYRRVVIIRKNRKKSNLLLKTNQRATNQLSLHGNSWNHSQIEKKVKIDSHNQPEIKTVNKNIEYKSVDKQAKMENHHDDEANFMEEESPKATPAPKRKITARKSLFTPQSRAEAKPTQEHTKFPLGNAELQSLLEVYKNKLHRECQKNAELKELKKNVITRIRFLQEELEGLAFMVEEELGTECLGK